MAYEDDRAVSENQRQQDHKAATTPQQHITADQNHYLRLANAARKWGVHNGAMAALLQQGGTPPNPNFQQGDF